jgi:solute carrier family 25 carnitine/acylcarnitine transporter 20/29
MGGGESSGGALARLAGALVGGVFAGVVSHPFDTIKTCLQGDVEGAKFRSPLEAAKGMGLGGLYRGVGWRSCIIVSATLLINAFKDCSAPWLFPGKFTSKNESD